MKPNKLAKAKRKRKIYIIYLGIGLIPTVIETIIDPSTREIFIPQIITILIILANSMFMPLSKQYYSDYLIFFLGVF